MNAKAVSSPIHPKERSFYRGSIRRPTRDPFSPRPAFFPTTSIRLYDGITYSDSLAWRYKQTTGRTGDTKKTINRRGRGIMTRWIEWRNRYHPLPLIVYSLGVAGIGFLLNVHF